MNSSHVDVVYMNIDLASGLVLVAVSLPLLIPLGIAAWFGHVRRRTFIVPLAVILVLAAALEIWGTVRRLRFQSTGSAPALTSPR